MAVKLAQGETVLKTYQYSQAIVQKKSEGASTFDSSLTVTNKRIISETGGEKAFSRKEIPIEAADYIDCAFATGRGAILWGVLLILIGIVVAVVGATALQQAIVVVIGVAAAIVGIIFVIIVLVNKHAAVVMVISGKMGEHPLLGFGASSLTAQSKTKKIEIAVSREEAQEMLDELGALILSVKEGTYRA